MASYRARFTYQQPIDGCLSIPLCCSTHKIIRSLFFSSLRVDNLVFYMRCTLNTFTHASKYSMLTLFTVSIHAYNIPRPVNIRFSRNSIMFSSLFSPVTNISQLSIPSTKFRENPAYIVLARRSPISHFSPCTNTCTSLN